MHSGYGEHGYVLIGQGTIQDARTGLGGEELVSHEVAHSWWGSEVGFENFASEALAIWATLGFLEATNGPEAATAERARAVKRVISVAAAGREVALADIEGFGAKMDPQTYRVHAYEKGMLLLSMIEKAVGRAQLDAALSAFLDEHRGAQVGWTELRAALAGLGSKARPVLEQWELPGIPILTIEQEGKKSGSKWRVNGTLHQGGTKKPFPRGHHHPREPGS